LIYDGTLYKLIWIDLCIQSWLENKFINQNELYIYIYIYIYIYSKTQIKRKMSFTTTDLVEFTLQVL
jgi:hypothetical protein